MLTVTKNKNILDQDHRTFKERDFELKAIDEAEKQLQERIKKSPYTSFAQINLDKKIQQARRELHKKNANAILILDFLIENMDNTNALICSYKVFEEMLGLKRQTAYRGVKALEESNFIEIHKSGTTNVYCINSSIAWKSWGKNIKYAQFNASVILTETEQEKRYNVQIKSFKQAILESKE